MTDGEFLLEKMAEGWRLETDCGPFVQFVQDRFAPNSRLPPVYPEDVGRPGYHGPDTYGEVLGLCARRALVEFRRWAAERATPTEAE